MLLRAYRLTDKFSLVLLKTLTLLATLLADGLLLILQRLGQILGVIFGVLALIFSAVARVVLTVLRWFGGIALGLTRVAGGVAVGGINRAGGGTGRAVGGAMARRAARAQLDAGVAEDPLRAQNRVLSGLFVVTLVALIGIILWATRPQAQPLAPLTGGGLSLAGDPTQSVVDAGGSVSIATPIPTATQVPEALAAGGSIAFTVRENGQNDLWVVGVNNTRNPLRITNDAGDERSPAWSPDGRRLAFASNKDGNWDLYVYDLTQPVSGGNPQRVTVDLSFQGAPSWSPDGFWLVYESYLGRNLDIYILAVDGSQAPVRLPGSSASADFSPVWSPDGRNIAFTSWQDGASQDIYVFSLDTQSATNLTQTPNRNEDFAMWHPATEGDSVGLLTFSAVDAGRDKVFVKSINDPAAPAQVIGIGREPAWSPDGASIIAAVDSIGATHLTVYPYTASGVPLVINAPPRSTAPVWTRQPLPASLVNSGGLPAGSQPLYSEQVGRRDSPPYYLLNTIGDVDVEQARLSDQVNDSFMALREKVLAEAGWDFLGRLDDAWWTLDYRPQPGEEPRNWHLTGRAFSVNRAYPLVGFPPQVQVVREDGELSTTWRQYLRVVDEAQSGQLGEPLRQMPWDFTTRDSGDVQAYEQGGKLRGEIPEGYYVDFTELAADYGWLPYPASSDWRANTSGINYWMLYKPDNLNWLDAMRELYLDDQLGGWVQPTVPPATPAGTPETQATTEG